MDTLIFLFSYLFEVVIIYFAMIIVYNSTSFCTAIQVGFFSSLSFKSSISPSSFSTRKIPRKKLKYPPVILVFLIFFVISNRTSLNRCFFFYFFILINAFAMFFLYTEKKLCIAQSGGVGRVG
jgi:hypothetical protein